MSDALPEWYPLANAAEEDIASWLSARIPPYDQMATALPWLNKTYQCDAWIDGVREAERMTDPASFRATFPGVTTLPLPPRRLRDEQ